MSRHQTTEIRDNTRQSVVYPSVNPVQCGVTLLTVMNVEQNHNSFCCFSDDTQEGRTIRISKSGVLNIYIAVDISESIKEEQFDQARKAIIKLVKKVRHEKADDGGSWGAHPDFTGVFRSAFGPLGQGLLLELKSLPEALVYI